MTARLYFDDPDVGPARETSHPDFVRACEDRLFYDCTDDFGPFGNDDGADALSRLEDWYREGAKGTLRSFIDGMLQEWGMTIPDLATTDRETVNEWLADEELETALRAADNLVIAVAFGEAKITGKLDNGVAMLARAALDREAIVFEHYSSRERAWPHAASANAAINVKRAALEKLEKARAE
ncbi:MAG: hypothetical protein H0T46_16080 [Deltaproteobacteria bacterium]|nr:hypothetical protein [Deltaproteobacteria bacterium]